MKVAIVGSGGFIGRRLLEVLEAQRVATVPISSRIVGGIDPETGLVSDKLELNGADSVVYLAQSPNVKHTPEMASHILRVNVLSAVEVAEVARKNGVRRFIYTSTGNVYRPSFSPRAEGDPEAGLEWYSLSKLQGEQALALFREYFDVHILRLFGVYGPSQTGRLIPTLIKSVTECRPVYLERNPHDPDDISGLKISISYIDDVVRTIMRMCQVGGPDLLNVAGDEVISVRSAAQAIGEATGVSPKFCLVNDSRRGDLIADVTRVKQYLATPFTPFELGLRNILAEIGSA